ncbi:hypothetical protein [Pelagerythrobacter aerophilus]|uniref:Uncharacterized protein n=1 Tax=Pelagerythrobacter aerophilus TaxID=2306995 RepID=A0A418NM97_9SPHN|nr:hypothetical protein [Pelagerythrobacter aerophilus]RIV81531.1 hypothetical protein D2V04_00320 [Pelagerythrobacter aerophilus]
MEQDELDALISENIADLELALTRVEEVIDPRLNEAAWKALKRGLADEDYHFEDDDDLDGAWFAPRTWLDKDKDSDPWFRLTADDSDHRTWLASYIAPRTDREAIGIQWYHDNLYVKDYKQILEAHADDLRDIESAGFRRDGNRIYLPIQFDAQKIAQGLRNDDLAEAMEPVLRAAEALLAAREAFQHLRDAMVAKASA